MKNLQILPPRSSGEFWPKRGGFCFSAHKFWRREWDKEKAAHHIRALTPALPLGLSSWQPGERFFSLCRCLKRECEQHQTPVAGEVPQAALPGLLQVRGAEVSTSKCFSTQVPGLISLPSQSLESNTECIGCLQQQLNSCTLVNLPRNPPAADTLLARHSGLRCTGAPLSDCRWERCAGFRCATTELSSYFPCSASFVRWVLTLLCSGCFLPQPRCRRQMGHLGVFMDVRLLLSADPGKIKSSLHWISNKKCWTGWGDVPVFQREAGNCTELPKAAEIRGDESTPRSSCAQPQLRSQQAPLVHRESHRLTQRKFLDEKSLWMPC